MDINLIISRHKKLYIVMSVIGEILFIVIALAYVALTSIPYVSKKIYGVK